MVKKFVIQAAMSFEVKPFKSKYPFEKLDLFGNLPIRASKYCFEDKEIYLVSNGTDSRFNINRMGMIPAALTTKEIIDKIKPDFVICVGGVGAISSKAELGKVYVNEPEISYSDRVIPAPGNEYGLGKFPTYDVSSVARKFGVTPLKFSSANSVILNASHKESLKSSKFDTTDMESVAVAEVCHFYGSKMFCVKGVTNNIFQGDNPAEQANPLEPQIMELVAEKTILIIDALENLY